MVDQGYPESELIATDLTATEMAAIEEAIEQAKLSDVVIVVAGEDEKRCGESK